MKKLSSYIVMLLMGMATFSFSSCDEDTLIAMTLEGTWQGDMEIYHTYNGKNYEATWSEICFEGNPFQWTSGSGYWLDYYPNSPWSRDYVANHITWKVNNQIIYIHFVEDNYDIAIHDYSLSDNYFYGTIWDGATRIDFSLRHVSSPNWNDYYYGWDYYSKGENGKGEQIAPPVRHFGKIKE